MKAKKELATESYLMACRRCERTWRATYQVLSFHDDAGDHRLYYREGIPVMAPESTRCPYCGGQRVTLLPHPRSAA